MQLYEGTNRTGMIQLLEDWTGTESSSNYTRQAKTRDLNLGLDEYMALSIPSSGTWQADDFNHTRYPNFTFDIVSGQQDYNFDEDLKSFQETTKKHWRHMTTLDYDTQEAFYYSLKQAKQDLKIGKSNS